MLIYCLRNISDYYPFWKQLCCLIIVETDFFQDCLMNNNIQNIYFLYQYNTFDQFNAFF